ncbi:metallophosphoesterase family protein [Hutsoniella sourekii]
MELSLIGDLHFSDNYLQVAEYEETRDAYIQHVLDEWFKIPADYHISIGDLTNMGTVAEFQEIFDRIAQRDKQKDFALTIGNHDAYSLPKDRIQELVGQPLNRVLYEDDQLLMIILDTNRVMDEVDYSGILSSDQLDWLRDMVASAKNKVLVVLAHHPVYGTTYWSDVPLYSIDPDLPVKEILEGHQGPGLYINGHTHCDSIVRQGNWHYIQFANFYDQPYFRNLTINEKGFSLSVSPIEEYYKQYGIWLGANSHTFKLNKRGYQGLENREVSTFFNRRSI